MKEWRLTLLLLSLTPFLAIAGAFFSVVGGEIRLVEEGRVEG